MYFGTNYSWNRHFYLIFCLFLFVGKYLFTLHKYPLSLHCYSVRQDQYSAELSFSNVVAYFFNFQCILGQRAIPNICRLSISLLNWYRLLRISLNFLCLHDCLLYLLFLCEKRRVLTSVHFTSRVFVSGGKRCKQKYDAKRQGVFFFIKARSHGAIFCECDCVFTSHSIGCVDVNGTVHMCDCHRFLQATSHMNGLHTHSVPLRCTICDSYKTYESQSHSLNSFINSHVKKAVTFRKNRTV